jgi:hypothetical protein
MSLTSYRAAPPREKTVTHVLRWIVSNNQDLSCEDRCRGKTAIVAL